MSTRPIRARLELRRPAGGYGPYGAQVRSRALTLGLVGALLGAELILAVAIVRPGAEVLLAPLLAAVGLALAFAFPLITACVYIGLIATVLYSTYFSASLGVNVAAPQLVLGALLVVAVVRPRRQTLGGAPGAALGIFLALVVLAAVLSVAAGRTDATTSRDYTQPFAYLLFYYVCVRLFPEREQMWRLLRVAAIMAGVAGGVALLVALFGSVSSPLQDKTANIISDNNGLAGLLRVRLPGVALAYGLFWFAVVELTRSSRRRLLWGAVVAGLVLAVVVSLNRNMWIGLIFGFALMLVVGGALTRRRMLVSVVALVTGVCVLVLAGPQAIGPTSPVQPLVKRGETLLAPGQELNDQSLKDRGNETDVAWHALQGHFVAGLGVGVPFGVTLTQDLGGGRFQRTDQLFVHNQYLYLVVAGGVGALAAFLAFLGGVGLRLWRARERDPALAGLLVGVAMVMLSGAVMISFVDVAFMTLLTLIGGAAYTLGEPPRRARAGS